MARKKASYRFFNFDPAVPWASDDPKFWSNLLTLRSYFLLSVADICIEVNRLIGEDPLAKPFELTLNRLRYLAKETPQIPPSTSIYQAVARLFNQDKFFETEIEDAFTNTDISPELCFYIAGVDELDYTDTKKEDWNEFFWNNHAVIDQLYRDTKSRMPLFGMTSETIATLKYQKKLFPQHNMKAMADELGLHPYPRLYLKPFSSNDIFLIKNNISRNLLSPEKISNILDAVVSNADRKLYDHKAIESIQAKLQETLNALGLS